jgi:hypothetical protein
MELASACMKLIIAGSRTIVDYGVVCRAVIKFKKQFPDFDITEVVSGGASGVDTSARKWAFDNNISLRVFYAEWSRLGISAGIKRNIVMGDYSDGALVCWDGSSKGARHMYDYAVKKGLPALLYEAM